MARTLVLTVFFALVSGAAAASDRIAMVIGMGEYAALPSLANPIRDAEGVASTLSQIGFEVETLVDRPQSEVLAALDRFAFQAETADLALIYFAGHGVQVQGENYLLPVDARVTSNADIARQSLSLKDFLSAVDRARRMRIVILDACRDNPFGDFITAADLASTPTATNTTEEGRSVGGGGLAPPEPERGTLVAYAARDGQVALDGVGENSPFAKALIETLPRQGLEISLMFRQVRDKVLDRTSNQQEPYVYGSLPGLPFYLAGAQEGEPDVVEFDAISAWSTLRPEQELQLVALAEAGDTRSMVGLAYKRLNAADDFQPEEAYQLFSRAADAGSPVAQFELAKLYEKGIGVEPDRERALELFHASADEGFADALNDLGFLYYQGAMGLPTDRERALEYFRRAADERHPEAQFNFAALIDDGLVPGRGPEDAARYVYGSLRSGSERALELLGSRPTMFSPETRRALQEVLKEQTFYDGVIDGDFGPGTQRGLRAAFGLVE
ncbi:MAG: caspase family protein [Pseudomonadota bacterium]